MTSNEISPRNRAERRLAGKKARTAGAVLTAGSAALAMGAAWVGPSGMQAAGAATFSVTSATDDGTGDPGTLSAAINDANGTAGADVIEFAVPGGVITVSGDLPTITEDVTISGPGAASLTIDGQDANSLFYLTSAVTNATISGLTLTNGSAAGDGGAILSGTDNLTLDGLVLSSNTAADAGGAVAAWGDGALVVTNSTFVDNVSTDMGGGLYTNHQTSVVISGSTFEHNVADDSGGGVSVDTALGDVSITGSTFVRNEGTRAGGLYLDDIDGLLSLTGVTITDNLATSGGGGGLSIFDTNDAVVSGSTISGNEAEHGGGLYSNVDDDESVTVEFSTLSGNLANDGWGGGLYLEGDGSTGSLTVRNSTFDHNTAVDGGGGMSIYNVGTPVAVTNSTISTNTAQNSGGGGILAVGLYGLDLVESTVSANTAPVGAGLEIVNVEARNVRADSGQEHRGGRDEGEARVRAAAIGDGKVNIVGSIVAGNTGANDIGEDAGTATADHSLIGVVAATFQLTDLGGNLFGVDPLLGPLANNGGPTQTHELLAGSPAINAGPDPVPTFPGNEFDQRGAGFPRVTGGMVDIGAFEVQPVNIAPRFTG